jgi:RecB family exonuclease
MTVKTLDELNDLEKLSLIEISYSRFDTYQRCEAKYFYTYILKQRGGPNAYSLLGNVVHSVLENKYDGPAIQLPDLLEEYKIQLDTQDPDGMITDQLVEAGVEMLEDFVSSHQGIPVQIHSREMEFGIVVGRAFIRGFIDRVDIEGDTVKITDYKSGKKEVTYKDVPSNLQLGIYALAAKKMFPDKTIHAELFYLRSERHKGHTFTDKELDEVEQRVIAATEELINRRSFRYTGTPNACYWCDFAKDGTCSWGANNAGR